MLLANEIVARWCQEREVADDLSACTRRRTSRSSIASPRMCESLGIEFDIEDTRDPKKLRRPAQVVRGPPAGARAQLAAPALDEAGDLRHREHRPLRARVEGVPALHVAHPPLSRTSSSTASSTQVLTEGQPRRDDEAREKLADAALASSIAERRAMEVERAVVDLYRTFLMKRPHRRAVRGDGHGGRRLGPLRAARRAVRRRPRPARGPRAAIAGRSTTTRCASSRPARATSWRSATACSSRSSTRPSSGARSTPSASAVKATGPAPSAPRCGLDPDRTTARAVRGSDGRKPGPPGHQWSQGRSSVPDRKRPAQGGEGQDRKQG